MEIRRSEQRTIGTALIAVGLLLPSLAAAQSRGPACLPRATFQERLASKYGEHVTWRGISSRGAVIEIWSNEQTGTWSSTMTAPAAPERMFTCFLSVGSASEDVSPPAAPGNPT